MARRLAVLERGQSADGFDREAFFTGLVADLCGMEPFNQAYALKDIPSALSVCTGASAEEWRAALVAAMGADAAAAAASVDTLNP